MAHAHWRTNGLQHLSRMLSHHGRGPKPCPLCDDRPTGCSLTAHILTRHKDDINLPHLTADSLLTHMAERDTLFVYRFNIFQCALSLSPFYFCAPCRAESMNLMNLMNLMYYIGVHTKEAVLHTIVISVFNAQSLAWSQSTS